jgi:hypothetical protein
MGRVRLNPHQNPRIDAMTGAQRLHWVLDFVRRDLAPLTLEGLQGLGDDLLHATAPWMVGAPWWEGKTRECTEMPAADVRSLQQDIRVCIQSVTRDAIALTADEMQLQASIEVDHGYVIPEGPERLVRVRFGRGNERIVWLSRTTNERTQILRGVAMLLSQFTRRVMLCPVCQTPFLRRYRKEYCDVKCSNKVRNRRRLDRKANQQKRQRRDVTRVPETTSLITA